MLVFTRVYVCVKAKLTFVSFFFDFFFLNLSLSIDEGVGLVHVPATRISVIVSVSVDGWHVPTTKISQTVYLYQCQC